MKCCTVIRRWKTLNSKLRHSMNAITVRYIYTDLWNAGEQINNAKANWGSLLRSCCNRWLKLRMWFSASLNKVSVEKPARDAIDKCRSMPLGSMPLTIYFYHPERCALRAEKETLISDGYYLVTWWTRQNIADNHCPLVVCRSWPAPAVSTNSPLGISMSMNTSATASSMRQEFLRPSLVLPRHPMKLPSLPLTWRPRI